MGPWIDPKIDCCFKALFGVEPNLDLLLHFLNAVLDPPSGQRIQSVQLLDPASPRERLNDKLSIVDVKAMDQTGAVYQLEVQLAISADLPSRMVFTHCDLVSSRLHEGEDYVNQPTVISIWILDGLLLRGASAYHHRFSWYDAERRVSLGAQHRIHTLELPRWRQQAVLTDLDRWTWFLRNAEQVDPAGPLPDPLETPEMRKAMGILRGFTESDAAHLRYKREVDEARWRRTLQRGLEEAERLAELASQRAEGAERYAEQAVQRAEAMTRLYQEELKAAHNERLRAEQAEQQRQDERLRAEQAEAELAQLRALLAARER